ncbi:MAG: hypothetical protein PHR68_01665 [Candidatus Gracilibacteria bacterium]|nr:hypothetical protein [Candidatus Gracilibacteria bacterium]
MTIVTFKENINISKTNFNSVLDFLEEIEDYALGKIMEKNKNTESFDTSLLEKKYIGK